jgi:hypothetical protein
MKKNFTLMAIAGLMLGMGAASAGNYSFCRSVCASQFQACRAAATNIEEGAACYEARYECLARCN